MKIDTEWEFRLGRGRAEVRPARRFAGAAMSRLAADASSSWAPAATRGRWPRSPRRRLHGGRLHRTWLPIRARPHVLGRDEDVPRLVRRHRIDGVLVGIGNTALARRAELFHAFRTLMAPPLVHPRAIVARSGLARGRGGGASRTSRWAPASRSAPTRSCTAAPSSSTTRGSAPTSTSRPGVVLAGRRHRGGRRLRRGRRRGDSRRAHRGGAPRIAGAVVVDDVAEGATVLGVPASRAWPVCPR